MVNPADKRNRADERCPLGKRREAARECSLASTACNATGPSMPPPTSSNAPKPPAQHTIRDSSRLSAQHDPIRARPRHQPPCSTRDRALLPQTASPITWRSAARRGAQDGRPRDDRVERELVADLKAVRGKRNILFALAGAAVEHPDDTVRRAIFPVVGEQTLRELVREAHEDSSWLCLLERDRAARDGPARRS